VLRVPSLFFGLLFRCFYSRRNLLLENLVLRQQLSVFQQRKHRPTLAPFDKLFWIGIRKVWSQWKNSLVLVTPETVVRWHRAGFRRYWGWRSRHPVGRKLDFIVALIGVRFSPWLMFRETKITVARRSLCQGEIKTANKNPS